MKEVFSFLQTYLNLQSEQSPEYSLVDACMQDGMMSSFYQCMNINGISKKVMSLFCHSRGLVQVAPLYFFFYADLFFSLRKPPEHCVFTCSFVISSCSIRPI